MQTVGIDLSAEPKGTAIATVTWSEGGATVSSLQTKAEDDLVLHFLHHPDRAIGVDCPLGWPVKFVEFVGAHDMGDLVAPSPRTQGWRREFVMRRTDLFVRERTGIVPLTVAADRIGHTALRLAALMSELGPHIDRSRDGRGSVVEVYPAAALHIWGLPSRGYKGSTNAHHLDELVDGLQASTPWLDLGLFEQDCRRSDDAFDAVICALVAKAAKSGRTVPPDDPELARREGWIHLPDSHLPLTPWR